jgi:hypothetical protein
MDKSTVMNNLFTSLRSPIGFIAFIALVFESVLGILMITTDIGNVSLLFCMSFVLLGSLTSAALIALFLPRTKSDLAPEVSKLSIERMEIQKELSVLVRIIDEKITKDKPAISMSKEVTAGEKQMLLKREIDHSKKKIKKI